MQAAKEDPEAKAIRERERLAAARERTDATQELAQGMTADLRRMYGQMFSMFR